MKNMKTSTILKKARALIARPHGWIKEHFSAEREIGGKKIQCFCAVGAVRHVAGRFDGDVIVARYLDPLTRQGYTIEWNDRPRRRQHDVVALFDKAIARAVEQGV